MHFMQATFWYIYTDNTLNTVLRYLHFTNLFTAVHLFDHFSHYMLFRSSLIINYDVIL